MFDSDIDNLIRCHRIDGFAFKYREIKDKYNDCYSYYISPYKEKLLVVDSIGRIYLVTKEYSTRNTMLKNARHYDLEPSLYKFIENWVCTNNEIMDEFYSTI